MPIAARDLQIRYTDPRGAGRAGAPDTSLGGYITATQVPGGSLHNLFPRVTGPINAAGRTEYRCVAVVNRHPSLALASVKVWLSGVDPRGASVSIGLDPNGAQASVAFLARHVLSPTTAPPGVTFTTPTTEATGLVVDSLPASWAMAIWVRRAAKNVPAANPETNTISISGVSPF